MVESKEVALDIREIKWHQEAIDSSMELLIKANRGPILAEIMGFFGTAKRRVQVFLAVDGKRTVGDVAQLLDMQPNNVSRELTRLKEEGLIEIRRIRQEGYIYKKRRVDRILGISRKLKREFRIQ